MQQFATIWHLPRRYGPAFQVQVALRSRGVRQQNALRVVPAVADFDETFTLEIRRDLLRLGGRVQELEIRLVLVLKLFLVRRTERLPGGGIVRRVRELFLFCRYDYILVAASMMILILRRR